MLSTSSLLVPVFPRSDGFLSFPQTNEHPSLHSAPHRVWISFIVYTIMIGNQVTYRRSRIKICWTEFNNLGEIYATLTILRLIMKSGIFAWRGVEDNSLWTVDKYNLLLMFPKSVILKKENEKREKVHINLITTSLDNHQNSRIYHIASFQQGDQIENLRNAVFFQEVIHFLP